MTKKNDFKSDLSKCKHKNYTMHIYPNSIKLLCDKCGHTLISKTKCTITKKNNT